METELWVNSQIRQHRVCKNISEKIDNMLLSILKNILINIMIVHIKVQQEPKSLRYCWRLIHLQRASLVTQWQRILLLVPETRVRSLSWEDILKEEMATHSSILSWKSYGQRSLAVCRSMGLQKSLTQLSS